MCHEPGDDGLRAFFAEGLICSGVALIIRVSLYSQLQIGVLLQQSDDLFQSAF